MNEVTLAWFRCTTFRALNKGDAVERVTPRLLHGKKVSPIVWCKSCWHDYEQRSVLRNCERRQLIGIRSPPLSGRVALRYRYFERSAPPSGYPVTPERRLRYRWQTRSERLEHDTGSALAQGPPVKPAVAIASQCRSRDLSWRVCHW